MPATIQKKCRCCKSNITVRLADHKRGWGNFCDKSCKARYQEKRNGQHAAYLNGRGVSNLHPERLKHYDRKGHYLDDSDPEWKEDYDDTHPFSSEGLGQW
jgi:hypothetical protein